MKPAVTIARQAGISMAGFGFGQLVRFVYNLAAARLLGAEALGTYALVVAIVQVGEAFGAAGLDAALLRFANLHDGEARRRVVASAIKMAVVAALASAAFVILLADQLSLLLHGGPLLAGTLRSAAAAIPVSVGTLMAGHAAQAFHKLAPKVLATQVVAPLALLALMLVSRFLWGVEAALLVPFVPAALLALLGVLPGFSATTGVRPQDILLAPPDRKMLQVALPLLGVSLLGMFSHWIDIMMLGLLADTRTVGLYQPAARTAGLLRSVFLAFSGIAAPMIAAYHARGDRAGLGRLYELVSRWVLTIVLFPALLLCVFPGELLSVFGAPFRAGAPALLLLAASALLQAWFGLGSTVLAMTGSERLSLCNQVGALLLQILLHLLFIPVYGMVGAALSSLVAMVLLSLARAVELRLLLGIAAVSAKSWKPLLSASVTGLALLLARPALALLHPLPALLLAAGAAFSVYVSLIRMFRLEQEELDVIFSIMPFQQKHSTNHPL